MKFAARDRARYRYKITPTSRCHDPEDEWRSIEIRLSCRDGGDEARCISHGGDLPRSEQSVLVDNLYLIDERSHAIDLKMSWTNG